MNAAIVVVAELLTKYFKNFTTNTNTINVVNVTAVMMKIINANAAFMTINSAAKYVVILAAMIFAE